MKKVVGTLVVDTETGSVTLEDIPEDDERMRQIPVLCDLLGAALSQMQNRLLIAAVRNQTREMVESGAAKVQGPPGSRSPIIVMPPGALPRG